MKRREYKAHAQGRRRMGVFDGIAFRTFHTIPKGDTPDLLHSSRNFNSTESGPYDLLEIDLSLNHVFHALLTFRSL